MHFLKLIFANSSIWKLKNIFYSESRLFFCIWIDKSQPADRLISIFIEEHKLI